MQGNHQGIRVYSQLHLQSTYTAAVWQSAAPLWSWSYGIAHLPGYRLLNSYHRAANHALTWTIGLGLGSHIPCIPTVLPIRLTQVLTYCSNLDDLTQNYHSGTHIQLIHQRFYSAQSPKHSHIPYIPTMLPIHLTQVLSYSLHNSDSAQYCHHTLKHTSHADDFTHMPRSGTHILLKL